jgi:hypothetical protein
MKQTSLICYLVAAMVIFACTSLPMLGQEFRGQIGGRIFDPSGAAIPRAQITITNLATNVAANVFADSTGYYTFLYLTPGKYQIVVQAPGFKKLVGEGIELRVDDQLNINLALEIGEVAEVVTVSATAPLLETGSSSGGQVIDQRRISDLPLSDGNPFTLNRLAPGITYFGDLKFSRPFDNDGTSNISVNGAQRGNEFTLDGSPNNDRRRVAFIPPSDAVQEFKVETAVFSAADGHTVAGNVNVMLKSGTNQLHGTAYVFIRNDVLSANDFFLNRAGSPKAPLRYNRYGGTVGGPVWLPKIYNGRNRTFFFFAYEGLRDSFPEPKPFTVPTEAERNGDFSALLALGPAYQIYDPLTAEKQSDGRIKRLPFKGNIIPPDRISSIAKKYLSYYPKPNADGDKEGRNNFIGPNGRGDSFHSEIYRFDHHFNNSNQIYFRFSHNNRLENRNNWSGLTNGVHATGNFLYRINSGGTWDHVWVMSPLMVFNYRIGFSRFLQKNVRQHQGQFDPASLGFSKETAAFFGDSNYFPRFNFSSNWSNLGDSVGDSRTHNIYSFQPTLTRVPNGGRQIWSFGYDFRTTRDNSYGAGHYAGRYDFGTNYTKGPFDSSASSSIGQDMAALILGQPTGGFMDRNASGAYQTMFHAVFAQLDWKITSRLALNLGLRYEYETGMTERYNRNIRGFDETSSNPIEAAAQAAYALKPIPEIAPDQFKVRGGYLFLTESNRGIWNPDMNNYQPRVGFAYRIGKSNVVRGGWGIYTVPYIYDGNNQDGFSQATNIVPTLDGGLTFIADLYNPFPSGVANPPGASLGLQTFLGRDLDFVQENRKNGQSQCWSINIQRELGGNVMVEAAYIGSTGYDISVNSDIWNAVPKNYLSTSPERDQATINYLTGNVANPFAGLIPGTSLNGSTTQRQNLLRPYPEFGGQIRGRRNDGSTIYHSGQFKFEKRFSRGYTILAVYTFSKLLQRTTFLNAVDMDFERRFSDDDRTHRITASGILELPFGRGKRWGSGWSGFVDALLGGWQGGGMFQYQSGQVLNFDSNYLFRGDPNSVALSADQRSIDKWFNTSGFETNSLKQLDSNYRTAPRQFAGLRSQPHNLWDLSILKNFPIKESVRFQVRGEFLNAFNHAQFEWPECDPTKSNFGKISQQANLARNIQIGLKLIF